MLHPRMNQKTQTRVEQKTALRVDPRLVMSAKILELPQQELEALVEQELADNPALEKLDNIDGEEFYFSSPPKSEKPKTEVVNYDEDWDGYGYYDSDFDWVENVASPVSLQNYLAMQLLAIVPMRLHELAKFVLDSVNDNGYLEIPEEEIANVTGANLEDVRKVVQLLQKCDPAGVGAHDLQECLKLQLQDSEDTISKLAYQIVCNDWQNVPKREIKGLTRKYKVKKEQIIKAFDRIASLHPFPGTSFDSKYPKPKTYHAGSVVPDIVFHRDENGIWIDIRGCDPKELAINRWYLEKYERSKNAAKTQDDKFIQEFVTRAQNFLNGLEQRRITLAKIAVNLLKEQLGFITTSSYRFLKPLTRTKLARAIRMHESTVSRATMNKFVGLPNGDVIPFEVFFKPSLRVKKMIEDILRYENPANPLSDREISEMLKRKGVVIARRTVNKYREQIRALSSHTRRSA